MRALKYLWAASAVIGLTTVSGCETMPEGALAPALGQADPEAPAATVIGSPTGVLLSNFGEQFASGGIPWPLARCVDAYASGRCARWR